MLHLCLLLICIFDQQPISNEMFSSTKSRYRIFSPKEEKAENTFCFYKSNKTSCGQTQSFGPDEYAQFKEEVKPSNNPVQILIAENIDLSSSLLIGNMDAKTVTVSGQKITGSIFIDQTYQLNDESGVLTNADISIDGSYSNTQSIGFLRIANNVQVHPKSITISLSDFPTDIQTAPSTGSFYSGPSMTATANPNSVDSFGGRYSITTSYFGGSLHWKGEFLSTTQMFCYCPSNNCAECKYPKISSFDSSSPKLHSNTTTVLIQLPNTESMSVNLENINRKLNYAFQGDNQNQLTLNFNNPDHISEIPSLSFSNLVLNFATSNSSVKSIPIHNTNVTLNNTTIADPWSDKVTIDNVKTDINSLESIINDKQDLVVPIDSSIIELDTDHSTFDGVNISKPIKKATFLTSNEHIKYSDSLGANITMKPSSNSNNQKVDVNILNDKSKLTLSSYKSINLHFANTSNSQNNQIKVEDFNNLNIDGTQAVSLDSIHLNGAKTKSAQIQSNAPLHLNEVVFEDEQSKLPKELTIKNGGQTIDADKVYVGKENSDLVSNLKMNKELKLESHSNLECSNCSFDSQMNYVVITGKKLPPPELKLSKGSADNFNPKSISIYVNSVNDDKSARYNITNKQYYPIVSQFNQDRCEKILQSIVDLPADMAVRCQNGVLELLTGVFQDFYSEHYSTGQIVGMVFASIIVATCAYLVFIYI